VTAVYINDFSILCALGRGQAVGDALASANPPTVAGHAALIGGRETVTGALPPGALRIPPRGNSRTNDLVAALIDDIRPGVEAVISTYGATRVAFVLGTSTTGIDEATKALRTFKQQGALPHTYRFGQQELGDPAAFGRIYSGALGPNYSVSTACTSGAKAMAAAARMIRTGLADAAICGGADTLCELTLNGFAALESISPKVCNPFSANRNGINIGEGGALFILSKEPGPHRLEAWGESSDAHHASAPDPTGAGAELAVGKALAMSGAAPDFVHAHGTATRLNDAMEAGLVSRLFGLAMPTASTKPMTGHTLGAAGAVQAALSLLAMQRQVLPPQLWDGARDPELPEIRLPPPGEKPDRRMNRVLSLSFAFGGNNIALMLAGE
jgi:3-oxoacyl-[acyl-carrier-protein] synthase-1